jgi:hypothetical protein
MDAAVERSRLVPLGRSHRHHRRDNDVIEELTSLDIRPAHLIAPYSLAPGAWATRTQQHVFEHTCYLTFNGINTLAGIDHRLDPALRTV